MTTAQNQASIGEDILKERFGFQSENEFTGPIHQDLDEMFLELATTLDKMLPPCRAKSLAMNELETAEMWANKAVKEIYSSIPKEE